MSVSRVPETEKFPLWDAYWREIIDKGWRCGLGFQPATESPGATKLAVKTAMTHWTCANR
jgi:hypothetical protein